MDVLKPDFRIRVHVLVERAILSHEFTHVVHPGVRALHFDALQIRQTCLLRALGHLVLVVVRHRGELSSDVTIVGYGSFIVLLHGTFLPDAVRIPLRLLGLVIGLAEFSGIETLASVPTHSPLHQVHTRFIYT